MNEFVTIMLTLSIATALLFGMITCMEKMKFPIYNIYVLNKIMCFLYLVPMVFIIAILYRIHIPRNIMLNQVEDFVHMEQYARSLYVIDKVNPKILTINSIFFVIWSIGFIVFFLVDFVCALVQLNHLLNTFQLCTEDALWDLMEDIKTELHINKNILLYQSDKIKIPFTTGFFRMRIVLPNTVLTKENWHMLLHHELVHCKRYDVFMKTLVKFVQKINWFNPCIYLFSRKFTDLCEFTCDMEVVKNYDREQRIKYGDLLVNMAVQAPISKIVLGFSEDDYKFIERRIYCIMIKQNKVHKIITLITSLAIFITACPIVTYASAVGVTEWIGYNKLDN